MLNSNFVGINNYDYSHTMSLPTPIATEGLWLQPSAFKQLKRISGLYGLATICQLALAWHCWRWGADIQSGMTAESVLVGDLLTSFFLFICYGLFIVIAKLVALYFAFSSCVLLIAWLIFKYKLKKRPCQIVSVLASLISVPAGTFVGLYALYFMAKNDVIALAAAAKAAQVKSADV